MGKIQSSKRSITVVVVLFLTAALAVAAAAVSSAGLHPEIVDEVREFLGFKSVTADLSAKPEPMSPTTVLGLGDIVFTGYQATTPDKISFVLLKSISGTTTLTVTDNSWNGTALSINEANSDIVLSGNFAAGTQFNYDVTRPAGLKWAVGTVTTNILDSTGASFALNGSGDNLFIYENSTGPPTSGGDTRWISAFATNSFLTTGSATTSLTYLPSAFTLGNNAFSLNIANGAANENGAMTSPSSVSGTASSIRSTVYTLANWTTFTAAGGQAIPPNITFAVSPTPAITTSTTSLASFGPVSVGSISGEQSYTVSGANLTADITVTAPSADFQVSKTSGSGFGSAVTYQQTGGTVATQNVYVRFTPQSPGAKSGSVTNASSGAVTQNVAVSGTGFALVVNNLGDGDDAAPGNLICATSGGFCTLRAALTEASQIFFNSGGSVTATITFSVTGNIPTASELTPFRSLNVVGPGANLITVTATAGHRVLNIQSAGTYLFSGLTIQNGIALSGGLTGNNVQVTSGANTIFDGVTIRNGNGSSSEGGGIYQQSGTLTIRNSTINNNVAYVCGGVYIVSGTLNMTNTTVSNNSAAERGGGVCGNGSSVSIRKSTITGNTVAFATSTSGGGGIHSFLGTNLTLGNSIVAGNTHAGARPDIWLEGGLGAAGTFTNEGYNLIGKLDGGNDNGTVFVAGTPNATNSYVGTIAAPLDPRIGALGNNGGPTQTHALLGGGYATDKGSLVAGITTDQRGQPRPYNNPAIFAAAGGDQSDIGAFEAQTNLAPALVVIGANPTDGVTGVVTATSIIVTFNQAVNPATVTTLATTACTESLQLSSDNFATCVPLGTPVSTSGDTVFLATPISSLAASTTYKIRVTTAATSAAGDPLPVQFTQTTGFTTGAATPAETSVTLSGGNLTVTDANGATSNDTLTVSLSGGNIRINDPGSSLSCGAGTTQVNPNTCDVPFGSVMGNIQVSTLGGNDTLTVDLGGGDPIPAGGIVYNGGETASDDDGLAIVGGTQGTVTYSYGLTNGDGSVAMSNFGTISYTGLEPISNSGTATDVIFNLPAVPNAATLANLAGQTRLSGATFETTDFTNPSGSVTINRGDPADTLMVNTLAASYPGLTIGSGAAPFAAITFAGTVTLASGKNLAGDASGTITLLGTTSDLTAAGAGTISLTTAQNITTAFGSSVNTVDGALALNANQQVSPTSGNFVGILISGLVRTTGTGALTVMGKAGDDAGGNQRGIHITGSGAQIAGGTGAPLTVVGTGGAALGVNNSGVRLENSNNSIISTGANISVTGNGGGIGTSSTSFGIDLNNSSQIAAGGSGTVTVLGNAGDNATGANHFGVSVAGTISSAGGDVAVTGNGGDGGAVNIGVRISPGGQITAGGMGTVTVIGNGGSASGLENDGILAEGTNSITSGGGNVIVTGTGGGTGSSTTNNGVHVQSIGSISAGGAGTVTVTGNGGNTGGTGGGNHGVIINATTAKITSSGGSVSVTGTGGGAGSSSSNSGVNLVNNGQITAGGSGTVTVNGTAGGGTGGSHFGVTFGGTTSSITSGGGNVSVTGTESALATSVAINAGANSLISTAANGGTVTLTGNSMAIETSTAVISAPLGSSVTLKQRTANVAINLGASTNPNAGPLCLTDAELDRVTTAGTLNIGDGAAGAVSVSGVISQDQTTNIFTSASTTVLSGGDLGIFGTVNSPIAVNSGGVLRPGASPGVINSGNASLVAGSSFAVEIGGTTPGNTATNHDQLNVTGTVSLGNATLNLSTFGGFTPTVGETYIIINNDGVGDPVTGTFNGLPQGAVVSGPGINATIAYNGGDGNDVVLTAVLPDLSISNVTAAETNAGTTTFTFAVTLSAPAPAGGVTFDIATADGTAQDDNPATEDEDYVAQSLTGQTIAAGMTGPYNFNVLVNGDTEFEPDETFFVNVTNIAGAAPLDTQGLGTITNDDCDPAPVVTTNLNAGPGSLRQAVINACPGATITFAGSVASPILLTSGQITIDKNLMIDGPATTLTVQNTQAAGATSRVFLISGGVTAAIQDLTISGGNLNGGNNGGGILSNGATLNVSNAIISANTTANGQGGGLFVNGGVATLTSVTVGGNNATGTGSGAGIADSGGTVNITNSTIRNNIAAVVGGGILTGGAAYVINNSVIGGPAIADANKAITGGGIFSGNAATSINMTGGSLSRNEANGISGNPTGTGGGLRANTGTLTFTGVDIAFNKVTHMPGGQGFGGAVYRDGPSVLAINLSRFIGNTASNISPAGGDSINNSHNVAGSNVNAANNWWGCDNLPPLNLAAANGCDKVATAGAATITTSPRIDLRLAAVPNSIAPGGTSTLTADVIKNSAGADVNAGLAPTVLVGKDFVFAAGPMGSINAPLTVTIPASGSETKTFTANSGASACGTAMPTVQLDNGTHLPATPIGILCPDLVMTKTDSNDPATVGNDLTYTLTLNNTGSAAATSVQVTDTIPANTTFVSSSAGCSGTSTVTCSLGTINAGGSSAVTIVVTPTAAAGGTTISNTASVTTADVESDLTDNSDTETTDIVAAVCTAPPVPANMAAWYSGGGNHSRDIQGPTFENLTAVGTNVGFAAGKVDSAFSFGGTGFLTAGGTTPPALNISGNQVTLDGWIFPTVTTGAHYFGRAASGLNHYALLIANGGVNGVVRTGSTEATVNTLIIPPLNTWTHLAMTYDGAFVRVYINGVLSGSQAKSGNISTTNPSPFNIGGRADGFNFNGRIDEVEVFNTALTQAQIAAIYNSGTAGKCKSGLIEFSAANITVSEANPQANFTVRRTDGAFGPVSATFNTSDGTAVAPDDYTAVNSFTVNFADGDAVDKIVTVPIINDLIDESDETVNAALSGATGGAFIGQQATSVLTITDDDTATASIGNVTQAELNSSTSTFGFTVTLSTQRSTATTINFSTADGSANAGSDYVGVTAGSIMIPANTSTGTINITVNGDTVYEANETFTVTISSPDIGTGTPTGTGTITNDDAPPATLEVNTTADTDDGFCLPLGMGNGCSLREAINAANANADATAVNFGIPNTDAGFAGGVYTIQPTGALPLVSTAMTIDGTSQANFGGDTNPNGPEVVVNGSLSGGGLTAFNLSGSSIRIIKGLVVNGFGAGFGGVSSNYQILDNYVGTDASGTVAVPNTFGGLGLGAGTGNLVSGNLISGNGNYGISTCDVSNSTFSNNRIGTDKTGTSNLGNGTEGISFNCITGQNNNVTGNTIAFNGTDGFRDAPDYPTTFHVNNRLSQNSIFSNGGQGIDLWPGPGDGNDDGLTPNDNLDPDTGSNNLQNFPIITAAVVTGSTRKITGTLNTNPNSAAGYTVEFFANVVCDTPGGNGEGATYLGTITTSTTDASGNVTPFTFNPAGLAVGQFITATTTDASGNTSEFSACTPVVAGTAGTIEFSGDPFSVSEGGGNATITVTRVGGTDGSISATFDTSNGTATAGTDYTAVNGLVFTYADGETGTKTVSVPITTDSDYEANETVNLALSNTTVNRPGELGGDYKLAPEADSAVLTIVNDDAPPATLIVNTTADTDDGICQPLGMGNGCTLREAIIAANFANDASTINFGIPTADPGFVGGIYTIQPTTQLPSTNFATVIAGESQPGYVASPIIQISGLLAPDNTTGLFINGSDSIVRNIIVNNFLPGLGVGVSVGSNNTISGMYIGVNAAGTSAAANGEGINTNFAVNTTLSGNVISGHTNTAVGGGWNGGQISNNLIGTDKTGSTAIPNGDDGIFIGGNGVTISGNTISGNLSTGIVLIATNSTIRGNFIGTTSAGTGSIPNFEGIHLAGPATNTIVGGIGAGQANIIANSIAGPGVNVFGNPTTNNSIRGNQIYNNGGLGIDLASNGITANDTGDGDTGDNNLQNFPLLTSAERTGSTSHIVGTLNSTVNTAFAIDIYSNDACDTSGNGEGQVYLGSFSTITNAAGDAAFDHTAIAVTVGKFLTATATDPNGNTSEFSACQQVVGGTAGTIEFIGDPFSVSEGGGPAAITVTRVGGTDGSIRATFSTADGTATQPSDYTATTQVVTFADGVGGTQTINVPIVPDTLFELDETVNLSLTNTVVNRPGGISETMAPEADSAVLTITNDDPCVVNPIVQNNLDDGVGSLRRAVFEACSAAGQNTITFNMASVVSPISLSAGQITLTKNVIIQGPGAIALTVRNTAPASSTSRVFLVNAAVNASISGLTISDGNTIDPSASGGGILNNGSLTINESVISGNTASSPTGGGIGGGVYSFNGTLNISNSTIAGNFATSNGPGAAAGGGIAKFNGAATITHSTIWGNTVSNTGSAPATSFSSGGGVFNNGGTLDITTSTLSGNSAVSAASSSRGGGAHNRNNGVLTLSNSTVTDNTASSTSLDAAGGGISRSTGTVNVRSSIIAENAVTGVTALGPDVFDAFTSQGFNLIGNGDGSTGFVNGAGQDQVGTTAAPIDPMLAPLVDNGGPTFTHALLLGSTAVDKGDDGSAVPTTDQRGLLRPFDILAIAPAMGGDNSDIGSYELQSFATTTVVASSQNPSVYGQPVTFTATVDTVPPGAMPVGTVNFFDNSVAIASCQNVALTSLQAQCTVPLLSAGAHAIRADYSGAAGFDPSSGMVTQQVNQAPTTTTIISDNPDPSVSGQSVTVVYTVTSPAGAPPGNVMVTFSGGGETCTASVSAGQCSVVLTNPGLRTITATYMGDVNFLGSSETELHTVNQAGSTTAITSDLPDPSVFGQSVTVTFTVIATAPGGGTPSGNVVVTLDGSPDTCTGSVSTGTCTLSLTKVGSGVLLATYAGDANFTGSTDTETHQVNQASTTTTVTSDNPDPSVAGETVVVNYAVGVTAPGAGTPTGTVVVTVSGGTETCTGTTTAGTCSLALNSVGARTITATYSGDTNFTTSNDTEAHQVNQASTTTTITSDNPDPSGAGQPVVVNYTVTANAPGGGTPTGNVVITVSGGAETCTGTVAAGTCTITLNGSGPRTITATYSGDTNYTGSSDTEAHDVGVSISGNIQQNNDPNASTPLPGVTVDLAGSGTGQATTDANGNYSFTGLTSGGNYTVTPSGLGKTYSPINRTYPNLTTNVTNANFTAFDPGQLERNLTLETTYVQSPNQAVVPITATVLGNERRFDFSLAFNNAILTGPVASCGADAAGCTITQDNSVAGAVGVTVTLPNSLPAGVRDLLIFNFGTLSGGQANTPVQFADSPRPRQTLDVALNQLASTYTGGFVVFTGLGLEGDLQTRFTGDGAYRANDVEQQRRFVSGIETPNAVTNEFERADVAPYATKGDGRLRADDFQLVMNYVSVLVAQQTAGGPDEAIAGPAPVVERDGDKPNARTMRIVPNNWTTEEAPVSPGRFRRAPVEKVAVAVEIDSLGDETVALFTLNFDASRLGNPVVTLAEGTSTGVTLTSNTRRDGQVTILLDSPTPFGSRLSTRFVNITFDVLKGAPLGETPITFDGPGSLSDAAGRHIDAVCVDGVITITGRQRASAAPSRGWSTNLIGGIYARSMVLPNIFYR